MKTQFQGTWEAGIWIPAEEKMKKGINKELQAYMEKAEKWDTIVSLAKEENQLRGRIKQIAQERGKLMEVL